METKRNMSGRMKKGMALVLVLAAMALALSGCITTATAPIHTDVSLGIVHIAQPITAANLAGHNQSLTEYGVFYSTNRADVVDVDSVGNASVDGLATIVTSPGVSRWAVTTSNIIVAASQQGTPTVDVKGLTPGKKYYYRFYTIGHDNVSTTQYSVLYAVDSFTAADSSLKSLKASKGSLSPKFSKTKLSYTDTISSGTSSSKITVAPSVSTSKVEIQVDGGAWSTIKSKTVSVSKGHSKTVTIRVTEFTTHSTGTYTVKVTRK